MKVHRLIQITPLGASRPTMQREDVMSDALAVDGLSDNEVFDKEIAAKLQAGEIFTHNYTLSGFKIHIRIIPAHLPNHSAIAPPSPRRRLSASDRRAHV